MSKKLKMKSHFKIAAVPFFGLALLAAQSNLANATIDNTATATGTYGGTDYTSTGSTANVPVTPADPELTVVKTLTTAPTIAGGADPLITDAGDTIVYGYSVTNTGNVTLTGVVPVDAGPTFDGNAGTGSFTSAAFTGVTLAPGDPAAIFSATYELTALDIARSAGITNNVDNVAHATGTTPFTTANPAGTLYTAPDSAVVETTIPAGPKLQVSKSFAITDIAGGTNTANNADVGETVTYTYLVENIGNVLLTNVNVGDNHEAPTGAVAAASITHAAALTSNGTLGAAVSNDSNASASIWGNLGPGASVSFSYTHTVNQTEFNNQ